MFILKSNSWLLLLNRVVRAITDNLPPHFVLPNSPEFSCLASAKMKEPTCLDLSCAIFLDIKREKKSLVLI